MFASRRFCQYGLGMILLLAALMTAVLAVPAEAGEAVEAAEDPKAAALGFGERAQALWRFAWDNDTGSRTFAFAEVFRGARSEDGPGVAVVGLGSCRLDDYGGGQEEICRGGGFAHELAPGEFELDPLLDVATLAYSEGGYEQRVSWKATGLPRATPNHDVGPGGLAGSADVVRDCAAGGELFGIGLDMAPETYANLARGGGGGAGPPRVGSASLRVSPIVHEAGWYELTARFPARR